MSNVAKKKENAVAAVNFEADAGQGLNMTQEDLALPFLKVLGQWGRTRHDYKYRNKRDL
jgi:hypothetical protein